MQAFCTADLLARSVLKMNALSLFILSCMLALQLGQKVAFGQESCAGLAATNNSDSLECTSDSTCLRLNCNTTGFFNGYKVAIILLPCRDPRAVQIVAFHASVAVPLLKETFSSSRTHAVPLTNTTVLTISVHWNGRKATISADVKVESPTLPYDVIILSPSEMTLPPCSTGSYTLPAPSATAFATLNPLPSSSSSLSLYATPLPPDATCAALREIASKPSHPVLDCSTSSAPDCTSINCTAKSPDYDLSIQLMVDTCADPTTVVMGFDSTLGKNTFTFSESRLVSVYDNLMRVNVTLDQMKEAIGLQIIVLPPTGPSVAFVNYTVIPIDRSKCEGGKQSVAVSAVGSNQLGVTVLLGLVLLATITHQAMF